MATFDQTRHVELVAGGDQAFVIENEMKAAAIPSELPHLSVFLVNVVDVFDPKQDTLARVATLADLTLVPLGRDAGIAAPGGDGIQFLTATWIASYDTLETALDAAQAFRDRVNKLVVDWQAFSTQFNAPSPTPAVYTFPAADTSPKTTLINAYKVAKQDRYQKQIAKDASDVTLVAAQADNTYKQGLVANIAPIATGAVTNQSEMAQLAGFLSTLQAAGTTFAGANPSGVGLATFQSALTLAASQSASAVAFGADAGTLLALVSTYQSARQGEGVTASAAVTSATVDQISKTQALTAAIAVETAALAAVLVVCPDFDKHSIPFVDDTEP
jgi:hypothetical protein